MMIVGYIVCLVVFLGLDAIWLTVANNTLYQPTIGELLASKPNIAAIAVFYPVYVAGVLYFALGPALNDGNWTEALIRGALFGLFCYATYDLTNMATLKVWSLKLTLLDITWGTFLTGAASTMGFLITRLVLR
ncbi:MAG TPA: DUF2177 family protein [Rhizomicrobium sp.]|jgi:uncharacterized membrane protein|nr:DUF2177 family protein [Rhizomicrobium sp.]